MTSCQVCVVGVVEVVTVEKEGPEVLQVGVG